MAGIISDMGWVRKYIDEVGQYVWVRSTSAYSIDPPSRYISVHNPYLFYYMSLPCIIKLVLTWQVSCHCRYKYTYLCAGKPQIYLVLTSQVVLPFQVPDIAGFTVYMCCISAEVFVELGNTDIRKMYQRRFSWTIQFHTNIPRNDTSLECI